MRTIFDEIPRCPVVFGGNDFGVVKNSVFGDAVAAEELDRVTALILQDALMRHSIDGDRLPRTHPRHRRGMHIGDVTPKHLIWFR